MSAEELGGQPGYVLDVLAGVPLVASSDRHDCLGKYHDGACRLGELCEPDRSAWRAAVELVPWRLMSTAETGRLVGGSATRYERSAPSAMTNCFWRSTAPVSRVSSPRTASATSRKGTRHPQQSGGGGPSCPTWRPDWRRCEPISFPQASSTLPHQRHCSARTVVGATGCKPRPLRWVVEPADVATLAVTS